MAPTLLFFLSSPEPSHLPISFVEAFGPDEASLRYRILVEHQLKHLPPDWPLEIHVSPPSSLPDVMAWLGPGYDYFPRPEKSFGTRLQSALENHQRDPHSPVFAFEAFCPGLQKPLFAQAERALQQGLEMMLGTTDESQIYLIGLKPDHLEWMNAIRWESPLALADLLGEAKVRHLTPGLLPLAFLAQSAQAWQLAEKEYALARR